MRITRAADIGLRALMVLAGRPDDQTTVARLADQLAVPERHLGKVVQKLAAGGLVETVRGRGGGLRISTAGLAATAADVLVATEGRRPAVNCYDPPCPLLAHDCKLRGALAHAQDAFLDDLAGFTIAELATPLG
ncbi:MAG: Rrf2 family transcriptional regulator [Propionibacteriaceae bacterium]|nr:Rrf2 family transcriptional regulator [Propionibacteriaceae bacterium]